MYRDGATVADALENGTRQALRNAGLNVIGDYGQLAPSGASDGSPIPTARLGDAVLVAWNADAEFERLASRIDAQRVCPEDAGAASPEDPRWDAALRALFELAADLGRCDDAALHFLDARVRALTRDPKRLGHAAESFDDVFVGQATQPETLEGLCDGASYVFSSLGIRSFGRRPTYWEVDCQANLNVVERAEAAGVPCFGFGSVLHAPQMRDRFPIAEARERVVDALRASSMHATVIRPSGFFNDMQEMFEMARRGRVWVVGDGNQKFNPVHGADMAAVIAKAAREGRDAQTDFDVGGPDDLTMREIGELAFAALGKPPHFGRLPLWTLKAAAAVARPFSANAHALLTMFVMMSDVGGIASTRGTHHLADFFAELAAAG